MSIRKRGKIWYCYYRVKAYNKDGELYMKQTAEPVGTDYQAALLFDARKKAETFADKHGQTKPTSNIDDFFEKYCIEYSEGKKTATTIKRDRLAWNIFKQLCHEVRTTKDFTDDALTNFKVRRLTANRKKATIKRASVNRELDMLKSLAKWGYKRRYLSANYYDLVEKYKRSDSVKRPAFTDKQLQLLIDNSHFPYRAAYILGAWQGMRRSEMCFLEHSDFNWEQNTIEIKAKLHLQWTPKTNTSSRIIPIHPYILDEIKAYWTEGKDKSTFFLYTDGGKQLNPDKLTAETRKLCKKLNINHEFSLHSARHTFATRAQESGAPLRKVSKLLGHANTQITEQQYTHFKETEHFDAINLLKINVKLKKD